MGTPARDFEAAISGAAAAENEEQALEERQHPGEQRIDGTLALVPSAKTMSSAPIIHPVQHSEPSLRALLSDPLTGALMDDAMLLPCGHSFGYGGIHRILQTNTCISCGVQISGECLTPNLALQEVVKAFRHEQKNRKALSRKKQRERFIQDHNAITYPSIRAPRLRTLRELELPFKVGDNVMIKVSMQHSKKDHIVRKASLYLVCLKLAWFLEASTYGWGQNFHEPPSSVAESRHQDRWYHADGHHSLHERVHYDSDML